MYDKKWPGASLQLGRMPHLKRIAGLQSTWPAFIVTPAASALISQAGLLPLTFLKPNTCMRRGPGKCFMNFKLFYELVYNTLMNDHKEDQNHRMAFPSSTLGSRSEFEEDR